MAPFSRARFEDIRLVVALPAICLLIALTTGYAGIELTLSVVGRETLPPWQTRALYTVKLVLVAFVPAVAAAIGLLYALQVARPMRRLAREIRARLAPDVEARATGPGSEMGALVNVFDSMLLSFDKFVSDAHILNTMPAGILVIDHQGRIVRANDEARRLLGAGLGPGPLVDAVPPGIAAPLSGAIERARRTRELEIVTSELLGGLNSPGPPVGAVVSLFPAGAPEDILIILRDESQVRQIRDRMQRVDQLAAVGDHVTSIAHDLGGHLMALQTLCDLLDANGGTQQPLVAQLQARMVQLTEVLDEIRAFGHAPPEGPTVCRISALVEQALGVAQPPSASKGIKVHVEVPEDLPPVRAQRTRLHRAFTNILTNAFEATPPGGTITVAGEAVKGHIVVRFSNTGSYIPPERIRTLFTAFETTKPGGTGLGLPIARRVLTDHDGTLTVTSSRETGTELVASLRAG